MDSMTWILGQMGALAQVGVLAQAAQGIAATQPAPDDVVKAWYDHGLLGFYVAGSWFMIPLFILQVLGVGIIIERLTAYKAISIDTVPFRRQVRRLLGQNDVDGAIAMCDAAPGPVAATLAVGLRRYKLLAAVGRAPDQIESDVTKAIDDYGIHIIAILERHLPMLALIVTLAPLLGFLGTIHGMVQAFGSIEAQAGAGNIIQLTAAGIKVALYTTLLGLVVAIPMQWFHSQFTNRVNEFVLDVEQSATELIHTLALVAAVGPQAVLDDDSPNTDPSSAAGPNLPDNAPAFGTSPAATGA